MSPSVLGRRFVREIVCGGITSCSGDMVLQTRRPQDSVHDPIDPKSTVYDEVRGLVDSLPRWFEIAQENHRSAMRAWRDLLHANGLRLDDHEEWLLDLEAS